MNDLTFVNVILDADAVINNSSQKVGGSNASLDPAPKKVGRSGPRRTRGIYATVLPTSKLRSKDASPSLFSIQLQLSLFLHVLQVNQLCPFFPS